MVSKAVPFSEGTFSFRMNPKGASAANVQVRNQGTITSPLQLIDMATTTRVEMVDAQVSNPYKQLGD